MARYEFIAKKLDYSCIENAICRHYDLGLPSSSDFMVIEEGNGRFVKIVATKGIISCYVSAYKRNDGDYDVSVSAVKIL